MIQRFVRGCLLLCLFASGIAVTVTSELFPSCGGFHRGRARGANREPSARQRFPQRCHATPRATPSFAPSRGSPPSPACAGRSRAWRPRAEGGRASVGRGRGRGRPRQLRLPPRRSACHAWSRCPRAKGGRASVEPARRVVLTGLAQPPPALQLGDAETVPSPCRRRGVCVCVCVCARARVWSSSSCRRNAHTRKRTNTHARTHTRARPHTRTRPHHEKRWQPLEA
jgi:hypothetical protein